MIDYDLIIDWRLLYVGDVTAAERVVSVGAADEHLLVVDARQNADVVLAVVLQCQSRLSFKLVVAHRRQRDG